MRQRVKCEWEHGEGWSRERKKILSSASHGGGIFLALYADRQGRNLAFHRQSCMALYCRTELLVGMALCVCLQHSPQVYLSAFGRRSRTLNKTFLPKIIFNIHNCISNTAANLLSPCPTPHEYIFLSLQQLELCPCTELAINSMARKSGTFTWGNIQLLNGK